MCLEALRNVDMWRFMLIHHNRSESGIGSCTPINSAITVIGNPIVFRYNRAFMSTSDAGWPLLVL